MKVDPRHLEILAAIVDHGGLTEGANALGKSQPSVSRTLAALEQRLGEKLFEPGKRPLQPTKLCLAIAQEGRKIQEAGLSASKLIAGRKSGFVGAARVMGTPIFMDGVVSSILASFQSEFPDIHIAQSYGYAGEVVEQLGKGNLDMGIVPIRKTEVPESIEASEILPGRNVIACRVGHPLARKSSVKLSDITEYPWIAPPPDSPLNHDLRTVLDGIGVKDFKVSFTGGSLASVTNILSGSDALTVLPYSVVFTLRRQNTLAALSIRIGDPDRHLCILSRKADHRSQVHSRLIRFVKNEFATMRDVIRRHEQNSLWRK